MKQFSNFTQKKKKTKKLTFQKKYSQKQENSWKYSAYI